HAVLAEAIFNNDVFALNVAKLAQPLLESRQFGRRAGRSAWEYPAHFRNLRRLLLRARRQRPRRRRAAEQSDELAPSQSITSSASDSKLSENLTPSTLAVLRLITNSNFVGCKIGRSAGFAPLRIRPV